MCMWRYVTDVATLRHYKASFATRWARTHNLWLAKRDHYQLRQRKASYSLTRVAHYIPEECVSQVHTRYMYINLTWSSYHRMSLWAQSGLVWKKSLLWKESQKHSYNLFSKLVSHKNTQETYLKYKHYVWSTPKRWTNEKHKYKNTKIRSSYLGVTLSSNK